MEKFPSYLRPVQTHLFKDKYIELVTSHLRKNIFELLISRNNEEEYFDLELFKREYALSIQSLLLITTKIQDELKKELGWNTALAFGNTGLFIFSEKLPSNCW